MATYLITNTRLVNEGSITECDIRIHNGRIEKIAAQISAQPSDIVIDAQGSYAAPGVIDDQVHFREPGLTHKACIRTEAMAAVAGGTTTFMEMPNTVPNTLTQDLLAEKYAIAARSSVANYSFFMGVSNDNLEETLRTDAKTVCGLKIFMGSSTGNMLVDNETVLEKIFSQSPLLIATHCEDEPTVRERTERFQKELGDRATAAAHPLVRNEDACLRSSVMAMELAKKHGTRLHILHISTAQEAGMFDSSTPLAQKRITAEACVHHLWFSADDYAQLGNQIKCNPAIKAAHHRDAIWAALLNNGIDIIATDHAPHTWDEKQQHFWKAPSGLPLVQHSLVMMLEKVHQGLISLERLIEKMCHAPAICFQIAERGFVREGYWADLVLFDMEKLWQVSKENLLYQCGWSPLEGTRFRAQVSHTWVSGELAFANGKVNPQITGKRILFDRNF
jgi:dihydroorotase